MREISGRVLAVRKRAGETGELRESPAECGRVGNYANKQGLNKMGGRVEKVLIM